MPQRTTHAGALAPHMHKPRIEVAPPNSARSDHIKKFALESHWAPFHAGTVPCQPDATWLEPVAGPIAGSLGAAEAGKGGGRWRGCAQKRVYRPEKASPATDPGLCAWEPRS